MSERIYMAPTLTEFLLARIAEDEDVAREVATYEAEAEAGTSLFSQQVDAPHPLGMVQEGDENAGGMTYVASTSARVLAECEAKRRIVEEHPQGQETAHGRLLGSGCETCDFDSEVGFGNTRGPCPTLRALALPYANHPEYDEDWRI